MSKGAHAGIKANQEKADRQNELVVMITMMIIMVPIEAFEIEKELL